MPCIVQIYGPDAGKRWSLAQDITLGRHKSNTITLKVPNVSRHHARLSMKSQRCLVADLGSTNGTFVNDGEIDGETELATGDRIKVGGVIFRYLAGEDVEALYLEEVYQVSVLDGLTDVHNRRYLEDFLEREMARAARHGRVLCLALIDVDELGRLNDTFGRLTGDQVLRGVAAILRERLRREELVARMDGEEFALVLPEVELQAAVSRCENLRRSVEDRVFEIDRQNVRTTVSIGVAAQDATMGLEELIGAAAEQLELAQEGGRNRVVAALPPLTPAANGS